MAASRYPAKSRYSFTAQFKSLRSLSFRGPNAEILTSRLSCWLNPSCVEASGRGPVSSTISQSRRELHYLLYRIIVKCFFSENAKALCLDALIKKESYLQSQEGPQAHNKKLQRHTLRARAAGSTATRPNATCPHHSRASALTLPRRPATLGFASSKMTALLLPNPPSHEHDHRRGALSHGRRG